MPSSLLGKRVFIENISTNRYLFQTGDPMKGNRGDEGGWLASSGFKSPNVVGSDANYYNRAYWIITKTGDNYLIENENTKRYVFQDGSVISGTRGSERGWLISSGFQSPDVLGADANYYNRAFWRFVKLNNSYLIVNTETKRYLFQTGDPMKGNRGDEGGWLASPNVVGADANYYNRALWKITVV